MRSALLVLALVGLTGASCPLRAQSEQEVLRRFLGVWETEDTYHPASGAPLVERGVRTCTTVLREGYLRCETVATNDRGEERTYWFLINYNGVVDRYEMLSLWSNLPFKAVHALTPSAGGRTWRMRGVRMIGDPEPNDHYSDLVFENEDRILWTSRRLRDGVDPDEAPVSSVETWVRRPPGG